MAIKSLQIVKFDMTVGCITFPSTIEDHSVQVHLTQAQFRQFLGCSMSRKFVSGLISENRSSIFG